MKQFFTLFILVISQVFMVNYAKAQLTFSGNSYSIVNPNTNWNAKFNKGTLTMGNLNGWQVFFRTPNNYLSNLFHGKYYVLMSFNRNPDAAAVSRLNAAGIKLLSYVPSQTYWVEISDYTTELDITNNVNSTDFFVLQIAALPTAWKLDTGLDVYEADTDSVHVIHSLNLSIHEGPTYSQIKSDLSILGITLNDSMDIDTIDNFKTATVKTNGLSFSKLKALPYVFYIEPLNVRIESTASTSFINNITKSSYYNLGSTGLSGNGVKVNLYEFDLNQHIDFRKRNSSLVGQSSSNHGTCMAGLISGAGTLNPVAKGIAFQSNLQTIDPGSILTFNPPNLGYIPASWTNYLNGNINTQVSNHSFVVIQGLTTPCGIGSPYTVFSSSNDIASIQRPNLLQLFGAGNNSNTPILGCFPNTFHSIVSVYCASKNNMTIGAVDANNIVAGYSAYGPVSDGRIKPDMVAIGNPDINTNNTDAYSTGNSGTSSATATTAGCASLIYERYHQIYNTWPKATLIKGLLMNSADDIDNPGPDYRTGYGVINMYKAIENLNQGNYISGTVTNGQTFTYNFTPGSIGSNSKVMLIWQDIEGTPNSSTALINDLDLKITSSNGTDLPYILDSSNPTLNATSGADHLNNVEQIALRNTTSNYVITVSGFNIPNGASQEFFLLFSNDDAGIKVVYPNGGNVLSPGRVERIQWDAHRLSAGTLSVQWSPNGVNWANIATGLAQTVQEINWTVPATVTSQARVRVIKSGTPVVSDISDNPFSILDQPSGLSVSNPCENRFTLSWTNLKNADAYLVYRLDESTDLWTQITPVAQIANSLSITEPNLGCYYYTVRALNTSLNVSSELAIALKVCLTSNAHIIAPFTIIRTPGGCIAPNTPNIILSAVIGTPANFVPWWEVSKDEGLSWSTVSLTQTSSFQWVIPMFTASMGGWQYRLTYMNYSNCSKYVSNPISLDIDFDFTSISHIVLDPNNIQIEGTHSATLNQTAGVHYQWQINFWSGTDNSCFWDPITGQWFPCYTYFGWQDIDCMVLKRTPPDASGICLETDELLDYKASLGLKGYAHFQFTGWNSNILYHKYLEVWNGKNGSNAAVASLPHSIRCKAYNNSCTKFSDEFTIPLLKTNNTKSGINCADFENELSIFPNPSIDKEIIIKGNIILPAQLSIYNIEGKEMYSSTFKNQLNLNVSDWIDGCYFIKFVTQENVITKKFIISHK